MVAFAVLVDVHLEGTREAGTSEVEQPFLLRFFALCHFGPCCLVSLNRAAKHSD